VNPPAGTGPQVFVVVAQVPHQIGHAVAGDRPVVRDAGDATQRVVGVVALRIHLADDRVFGAVHRRQRGHRRAYAVAPVLPAYRLERPRWVGQPQFGCLGEQFEHVVEASVVDRRCVQVDEVGERQPVGRGEDHSGGRPLLSRMALRHWSHV
jgi:hypothetical protein